jgi:hypothetical protein
MRDRLKMAESNEEELKFLYSLAAVESFVSATAYIEELAEPAWNAVEMMTAEDWQSLTFQWDSLGCNQLPLLTKTDRRQMIGRWGEPHSHTTLRQVHGDVWQRAVDALLTRRVREHNMSFFASPPHFSAREYLDFVKTLKERAR